MKNMLLYKSKWSTDTTDHDTFKLIPINKECPFNECIFDPETQILAVVGIEKKQSYRFIPKIDDKGRPVIDKSTNQYIQERKLMENFYEYYIQDIEDITNFIDLFATNSKEFDWKFFIKSEKTSES